MQDDGISRSVAGWKSLRRIVRVFASVSMLATLLGVVLATPVSAVTGPSPLPLRSVGFSGHAEMYGWGATTMLDGSVLVGDYWNFRVRHFAVDGTLLGDFINNPGFQPGQHQAPYGLGVDPVTGDVYMADTDRYTVDKYSATGTFLMEFGSQGSASNQFLYPSRVVVGSDRRVYVVDTWANKVKVFTPAGAPLFSFGATGAANGQFKQPHGEAFDQYGRLWIADTKNYRIQVFDREGHFLFKFGSKGFMPGQFQGDMRGLAIDQQNSWVYQVDAEGNHVHKFSYDDTTSATHLPQYLLRWGSDGNAPGQFSDGGREITVDGQHNVWVGDMPNFRVQRFTSDGAVLSVYPNPPAPPAPGGFNNPRGVAADSHGNIFVTDTYNQRVEKFAPDGTFLLQWGTRGRSDDAFNYPRLIAVDRRNDDVIVTDTDNHRIKRFTNNGVPIWDIGGLGTKPGLFHNPHGVAVGSDGTIYVADSNNARVVVMNADGTPRTSWGVKGSADGQFKFPRGIGYDPVDGTLWVSDGSRNVVQHFTATGTFLGRIGTGGKNDNQFAAPFDVEADAHFVYVADTNANKVKVWTKSGTFVTAFGGYGKPLGKMRSPEGLDIDKNGHLLVAEEVGERIQEFALDTTAPTFAGLAAATPVLDTRVDLSWAAATDNMSDSSAIRYDICQATSVTTCTQAFTATYTTSAGAASFSATNLAPATAYAFVVRARDEVGNRDANGHSLSATTLPDTTLPSFGGITGSSSTPSTVNLSWAAGTDDATPGVGLVYDVCVGTPDVTCASSFSATYTTTPGATSFTVAGMAPTSTHTFLVRARDANGNRDSNVVESTIVQDSDVTAPLFGGVAQALPTSPTSVHLVWAAATDDATAPNAIVYDVCRADAGASCASSFTGTGTTAPGATSFDVAGLQPGATYSFLVRARDGSGNVDGNTVEPQVVMPQDTTAPTFAGVGAVAVGSSNEIDLSWAAAADDVTPTSDLVYQVCRAADATSCASSFTATTVTSPGATSFADIDVTPGVAYWYTVRAVDAAGNVDANTVALTTLPSFAGVGSVTPTSPTSLDVTWAPASDFASPPEAITYEVTVSTPGSPDGMVTAAGATQVSVDGLQPGTTYAVTVRARNTGGAADGNNVQQSATTPPDVTAPSFSGLASAANPGHTSLDLSWSAASDDVTPASDIVYQVCRSTTSGACALSFSATYTPGPGATSFTPTDLTPGVTYSFVARAVDSHGNVDANSVEIAAATVADTSAPTFGGATSAASLTKSTIQVGWVAASDDVTPANGIVYDICRSTNVLTCTAHFRTLYTSAAGATSYTVKALATGSTQYFVIRARDAMGNEDSNVIQVSAVTLSS